MQSNFTVEAQDVINELLEQIKQLSLSNAMLRAKISQIPNEKQDYRGNTERG